MITLFRTAQRHSLDQAKELLAKQIRQLPQMILPIGTPRKILRFEFDCHPGNLLSWLHNQKNKEKTYWSDRNQDFEMAGIGIADCLQKQRNLNYKEIFEYIEDRLSADNPNLKYYGGLCFNQNSIDHEYFI